MVAAAQRPSRIWRNAKRAATRFRNVGAAGLAADLWRAARLQCGARARHSTRRADNVVVTLTTIPRRSRALRPVLNSLIDQTMAPARIVLALPHRSLRSGEAYPDPPSLDLPPQVEVLRCADMGPGTKFLAALEQMPAVPLIVVDDDVIYPRDFVETLCAAHLADPSAVIAYRGVQLRGGQLFDDLDHVLATGIRAPTPVDIVFGTWGYLLPPHALDRAVFDFSGYPPGVRWVDDIWLSGHLARRGVRRLVVPARRLPIDTLSAWRQSLGSNENRSRGNEEAALAAFADDWAGTPSSGSG